MSTKINKLCNECFHRHGTFFEITLTFSTALRASTGHNQIGISNRLILLSILLQLWVSYRYLSILNVSVRWRRGLFVRPSIFGCYIVAWLLTIAAFVANVLYGFFVRNNPGLWHFCWCNFIFLALCVIFRA